MPKIDDIKEFANMTKGIFQDVMEMGTKKFKDISSAISESDFSLDKKYSENNQYKNKNADEYVDKYYELKEEVSLPGQTGTTTKKSPKTEKMPLDISFTEENIMQAVVYAEIFGKPKAKRRRR